jgi:adenylate kinase
MAGPVGAVVIFGPPGAGKGTQARAIGQRMGIPHISTGEIIRAQLASDTARSRQAKDIMAQGNLVPDEWVNEIVEARIQERDCERGFVLDGYPRTCGQAQALDQMLARNGARMTVITLALGYNEIIRRITARRMCPACGTIYNVLAKPPRVANVCDLDGAVLQIRLDDHEDVVRERIQAYERESRPVMEYFRRRGQKMFEVDGSRRPEEIAQELERILEAA